MNSNFKIEKNYFNYNQICDRNKIHTDKLSELNDEIKKQKDMSTYIFHELRNILGGILSITDIIKLKYNDNKDLQDLISQQTDICTHAIDTMNDILDICKLQSGKYELSKDVVNINEIFNTAIKLQGCKVKNNVKININILPKNLIIETDKTILTQFIINLLSNSVKYTEYGFITLFAETLNNIDNNSNYNNICIGIVDTGCGMPLNYETYINNNMYFKTNISEYAVRNTGFGLYLANTIAKAFNDNLHIVSPIPESSKYYSKIYNKPGTIVYINIKTKNIKLKSEVTNNNIINTNNIYKDQNNIYKDQNNISWIFNPKGFIKVLIVDDQKLNRIALLLMFKQLSEIYTDLNIHINTAISVEESERLIKNGNIYDIITMDEYFEKNIENSILDFSKIDSITFNNNKQDNTDKFLKFIENDKFNIINGDGQKYGSSFINEYKNDKSKIIISITGAVKSSITNLIIYKPFILKDFINIFTKNCSYLLNNKYLYIDKDTIRQNTNLIYYTKII